MTKARGILRTYPAGAAATGLAISIKREVDDVEIATDTTDGSGVWDYSANGSPGPWYWGGTDTAPTPDALRAGSTIAYGGGGAYSLYELVYALRALGNGVISGYLNALAVTYDAAGLDLDVATGGAVVRGIPCIFAAVTDHTVATTRDATNTKACYLVVRVTGAGETEEGKTVIADTCGTAAASPALPALTQTEALYELPLATFILPTTASTTLTSVVDVRTYLMTRNPVVSAVARNTDPTVAANVTSTSGADVTWASGSPNVTLLNGVVYDLTVYSFLLVKAAAGQTISIAPSLNADVATYISSNVSADYIGLANVHILAGVTGSGGAVTNVLKVKVSGGTGSILTGFMLVTAVPRT